MFSQVLVLLCSVWILRFCEAELTIKRLGESVIRTSQGNYRGVSVEFPQESRLRKIESFRGIQYGNIGGFRFMPPNDVYGKWKQIKIVQNYSYVCPQKRYDVSNLNRKVAPQVFHQRLRLSQTTTQQHEDCLNLNLFVPTKGKLREDGDGFRGYGRQQQEWNDTTPLPVMVFVHGESYDIGTGNAYDGSVLASYGEVIVVTVNYRLGVLGFLSTEDNNANGNYALLDLLAVLTWLNSNIGEFGGDVKRITLFGHGYGAALVNLLLLSPMADDSQFFQRAILQSGSAFSSWATSVDPLSCAKYFATNLNCSNFSNDTKSLVTCLRANKSAEDLVNNVPLPPKYYSCFAPTPAPGEFIFPDKVEDLLKRRSTFSQAQVMFGVTKNEAYSFMKQHELDHGISKERKKQIIRTYVQNLFKFHRQKIYEILDHQYSEWDRSQNDSTRLDNIMQMLSDGQYVAPLVRMAQEHAKRADTYVYVFAYSTKSEKFPEWSSGVHGDELPYVFGAPLVNGISPFPSEYSRVEKRLSEAVMTFWTNFAKTGNPNQPRSASDKFSGITWPKYDINTQNYLLIGKRPQRKHHYRGKELAVWLDLIPKIDTKDPGEKANSPIHNLINANNKSTFDDYNRLITQFHKLFPPSPPIPPITPYNVQGDHTFNTEIDGNSKNNGQQSTQQPNHDNDVTEEGKDDASTQAPPVVGPRQDISLVHSSVPLSITVAVGCSLLFLNILIFAGVYYQRERIKKLRRSESSNSEEMRVGRKLDKDGREQKGPETTSLMTSAQHNQLSPVKNVNTHQDVKNNPIYTAITKTSDNSPAPGGYSYTAVPTNTSSPMHRSSKSHHSHTNSIPSSNKTGNSISNATSGRPPDVSPRVDSMKNAYQHDKYNQITAKEQPNSNNAITIV
ncbi:neuroligin-4, X-linked-like isoform X3 [Mizuhopecten yessoensis]|uniref:neuroligin-4, X-linked-like isoform X3 n=1 Tax=Mizuhopecten yessoensis TaxID=6573 RepID=UPI000B45B777|nr:neuroligin-4, X-linked-like isoform X3 [Mizuhopecten yessoensis]